MEVLFFQVHLFYLRHVDVVLNGKQSDELQFVDYYLTELIKLLGQKVLDYLAKVPAVSSNLLRSIINQKLDGVNWFIFLIDK